MSSLDIPCTIDQYLSDRMLCRVRLDLSLLVRSSTPGSFDLCVLLSLLSVAMPPWRTRISYRIYYQSAVANSSISKPLVSSYFFLGGHFWAECPSGRTFYFYEFLRVLRYKIAGLIHFLDTNQLARVQGTLCGKVHLLIHLPTL